MGGERGGYWDITEVWTDVTEADEKVSSAVNQWHMQIEATFIVNIKKIEA